jgi:hypothetical protein
MQMPVSKFANAQPARPESVSGGSGWLSANALEPNFTLSPDWIGPMLATCARPGQVEAVQTLAANGQSGGYAVVERKRWRWGLPLAHAESWFGDFPISGTPLINTDDPAGNCAGLIEAIFEKTGATALLLSHVTGHHVVSSVLVDACAAIGAPIRFMDDRKRAALRCNGDFEAWFEETFARKRRKELRRLKSRLAETGELGVDVRAAGEAGLSQWIDSFIALEQAGWKGEAGTAIGQSGALTRFVRSSLAELDAAGKLMTWSMTLDGKPVAMMFGVRNGATASIVKMAHDESLNRFSPGQLLILEATRTLFDDDQLMFADSCAAPGHPMIDHLWKDRLEVRDVLIGNPCKPGAMFGIIHGLERVRRSAFRRLKSLRHLLQKGK